MSLKKLSAGLGSHLRHSVMLRRFSSLQHFQDMKDVCDRAIREPG